MKKLMLTIMAIVFSCLYTFAGTVVVYGSGGVIDEGGRRTYCPNSSNKACAKITSLTDQVSVGSQVTVEINNEVVDEGVVTEINGDPSIGGNVVVEDEK